MEYCRLIAEISRLNTANDLWWATSVASRNAAVSTVWEDVRARVSGDRQPVRRGRLRPLITRVYWNGRRYLASRHRVMQQRLAAFLGQGPVDVVLCSHFSPSNFDATTGKHRDAFWEPLIEYMVARGLRVVVVGNLVNDLPAVAARLASDQSDSVCRIPLACVQTIGDIASSAAQALRGSRPVLPEPCMFHGEDAGPVLAAHLKHENASGLVWAQLQTTRTLQRVMRACRPRWLLWPWENHSWEILMLRAVRRDLPDTCTVGYVHATVPPFLLNHFPGSADPFASPLPDHLVTTGPQLAHILERYGTFPDGLIVPGCAMRHQELAASLAGPEISPVRMSQRVLGVVLPIDPVIAGQVYAASREAIAGTDWTLHVRPHPLLSASDRGRIGLAAESGISISSGESMADYFSRVRAIAYCESTVGMESVASGVPTVRIDVPASRGALSDTMFECDALKWIAADASELRDALLAIDTQSQDAYVKQHVAARAYVHDYFTPVSDDRLAVFLPGLAERG